MVSKKPVSIDEHLWKTVYGKNPRRLIRRTGPRYRLAGWSHIDEMFSVTGSGHFNPGLKAWAILFLIASFAIAIPVWMAQPGNGLFHSPTAPCTPVYTHTGLACSDPSTTIWQATAPNNDLSEFNGFMAPGGQLSYGSACFGGGTANCMVTQGIGGVNTTVALSKSIVGDLSSASKSVLGFDMSMRANSGLNINQPFGYYLTTNGTVPMHAVGASGQYDPTKDPSVVFDQQIQCSANCGIGLETWSMITYTLRTLGQQSTVSSEDTGNCSPASSVFLCQTNNHICVNTIANCTSSGSAVSTIAYLNYTGAQTGTNGCPVNANGSFKFPGEDGCSWSLLNNQNDTAHWQSTQNLPYMPLQATQYFIGFYNMGGGVIEFGFNSGSFGQMSVFTFNAQTFAPPIDTGGFFGPVIKALISIGVFILGNIINFFVYLFGLVAGVLIAAFNAIGNGLGIGNIGSSLASVFSGIGAFILNVFGTIFGYVSNFATFLSNGLGTIGQVIGNFWTQATNGFSTLKDWMSNAWTVIQAVGFWFKIGFASFLFTWMLYGTILAFEDYNRFKLEWFNPTELFSIRLFGLVYWIGDKSFDLLWKGLQALKGWL